MGWLLVTIALPVLAPVISLLCMRAFPLSTSVERLALINVLKDGQLCWPSMAFCVSGLYELTQASTSTTLRFAAGALDPQFATSALIAMLVLAGMFAAGGSVFITPRRRPAGVVWFKHFRLLACSLALVACSAGLFSFIHFGVLDTKDMSCAS